MTNYYTSLQTRTHAFLLERRMKANGITCELAYLPRPIMTDMCSMGVKFPESELQRALQAIRRSGLPNCRIYKEIVHSGESFYTEVLF
ncbi:MAG: DUF3343 domain-containing protein [Clostridiales bacterium]|nr:DUF3343 domain-containing protein [Eubacteriales bacterium]MDH7567682.1 DUF3343 domain-containing protein [Clostridiales bacterium]